jgi:hypothetical protein
MPTIVRDAFYSGIVANQHRVDGLPKHLMVVSTRNLPSCSAGDPKRLSTATWRTRWGGWEVPAL